ncbi:MAG: hypothetical protein ACHQNE_08470 [Candidatus Kapaibacterium sp.]
MNATARRRMKTNAKFFAIIILLFAGCRTVSPVREIRPSLAPDVSRVMLKSGKEVLFNKDFGWYNQKAGTIEGVTVDSQHVEYHLVEIGKVETVRAYEVIPAAFTAGAILAAAIYLIAHLLALL